MNKSKITIATMAAAVMLAFAPSCSDNDIDPNRSSKAEKPYTPENTTALEKSKIAGKVTTTENLWAPDGFNDFAAKVRQFSNKTATMMGISSKGNTAVSPISIFMALSMSAECADNNTRKELLDALGVTYQELTDNIQYLCYLCNKILSDDDENKVTNFIKCVNSLWISPRAVTKEEGVNSLTHYYYSDIFKIDTKSNINQLIKSYVKNETRGLIDPDLELSKDVELVLMNVVYLKDVWKRFGIDLDFTDKKYTFHNYDGSTTTTPLLLGEYRTGKMISTDTYRKFYTSTNGGLRLTFIIPNDNYTLDDVYTTDVLNQKDDYVYEDEEFIYQTRCLFPEFTAEYDGNISEIVRKMGVNDLFSRNKCDFSHITDREVFCGPIQHVAKLEANRTGIEGAAMTMICMDLASNMESKKEVFYDFVVDRSFAYVLTYQDVPLFTGVVKKVK